MDFAISQKDKSGFSLFDEERVKHVYVIGGTGMGKSTMLENMILHDLEFDKCVVVIDPHGQSAASILKRMPSHRTRDVIYLDLSDSEYAVGFNPLITTTPHLTAQTLTRAIVDLWYPDGGTPRLDWFLYNGLMLLIANKDPSLLNLSRVFYDKSFRNSLIDNLTDVASRTFWTKEYTDGYDDRTRREAASPIYNKIGQFGAMPVVRDVIGQTHPKLDFYSVIENGQIVVVNLSKETVGGDAANLLGALLVAQLTLAAKSVKKQCYLYVDEFQNLGTSIFVEILSEMRKYKLGCTLAHQFCEQIPSKTMSAILGNVSTTISFNIGIRDAEVISKHFYPFPPQVFTNLDPYHAFIKRNLTNQLEPVKMQPPFFANRDRYAKVIRSSRERWAMVAPTSRRQATRA